MLLREYFPSAQQKIGNTEVTFYLSDDVFGFFVPMEIPVDLPEAVSTDINDPHGNRVGRVYAIPQDGGTTQSGILVLIPYIYSQ